MSFEIRSHSGLIRNLIDVLKSHLTPQNRSSMESFSMLSAIVTFRFLPWPALCTLHNGWKSGWDLAGQGLGDVITKCWSIFGTESHDQIFSDVIIFHKYVSPAARSPLHLNCFFSDLAHMHMQHWGVRDEIRCKARRNILHELFFRTLA